jgi:CheY-like chemotaxis protein
MVKQLGLDVLVVDDDYAVLELIERGLKEINPNLDVMTCLAAETALYLIDGGYTPDLVLVDFKLNGMNGVEFIKELRGRELGIPVALFTGDVEGVKKMVSEGEGVGGVPVLTKECLNKKGGLKEGLNGLFREYHVECDEEVCGRVEGFGDWLRDKQKKVSDKMAKLG